MAVTLQPGLGTGPAALRPGIEGDALIVCRACHQSCGVAGPADIPNIL